MLRERLDDPAGPEASTALARRARPITDAVRQLRVVPIPPTMTRNA